MRSRIVGTGHALPDERLTNAELAARVDTSDAWIVERTGIRERRILPANQSTSDLAAAAALQALAMAELKPTDLDCIIVGTVSPDMPMPATAVFVQQKIGAGHCAAFDLAAACAGFVYGLSIADAFIKSGQYRHVLVIGAEVLSRIIDWKDRNTCVIFGDGAGAAIVSADSSDGRSGLISTHLFADGSGAMSLYLPGGGSVEPTSADSVSAGRQFVRMNGKQVFAAAVKNISAAAKVALEHNHVAVDAVDCVVAHQANLRILEAVADRVNIPLEKFFINIEKYGNTSAASIPIALDEAVREGKIRSGDLVLLAGLGAGLSWGSALLRL